MSDPDTLHISKVRHLSHAVSHLGDGTVAGGKGTGRKYMKHNEMRNPCECSTIGMADALERPGKRRAVRDAPMNDTSTQGAHHG